MTIAFVFPGQGSQVSGMGRAFADASPAARRVFEEADAALGFALSTLCWEGPDAILRDTATAQPAIFTASVACLRGAVELADVPGPSVVAGHSLGYLTALAAANVFDVATGVRLARDRGLAMSRAASERPGAMAAVLGLAVDQVRQVCDEVIAATPDYVLVVANDNAPGQVVISGHVDAIEQFSGRARLAGARRVVPLAVSGAFHSPLMASAANEFAGKLDLLALNPARIPVIANTSAAPVIAPADVARELREQVCSPVRWVDSMQAVHATGVETIIEFGPGGVLAGLARRILPTAQVLSIANPTDLLVLATPARS